MASAKPDATEASGPGFGFRTCNGIRALRQTGRSPTPRRTVRVNIGADWQRRSRSDRIWFGQKPTSFRQRSPPALPRLREFDIMSSTDGEWRDRLSPNNNTRHRFWTPGGYGRRGIKLIRSGAVLTRTTWRVIYLTVIFLSLALTLAAYMIVEALIIHRLDLEARGNVQNEINLLGVKLQHSVDKINTVSAAIVSDPPPLIWSAPIVRNWRIEDGNQTTQAGRDCHEVAAC